MRLFSITAHIADGTIQRLLIENVAIFAGWVHINTQVPIRTILDYFTYVTYDESFLKHIADNYTHRYYLNNRDKSNIKPISPNKLIKAGRV